MGSPPAIALPAALELLILAGSAVAASRWLRGYPPRFGTSQRETALRLWRRSFGGMAVAVLLPFLGPWLESRQWNDAFLGRRPSDRLRATRHWLWRALLALALAAPFLASVAGLDLLAPVWSRPLYVLSVLCALWTWPRWLGERLARLRREARDEADRHRCPACGAPTYHRTILSRGDGSTIGRGESVGQGQSSYEFEDHCSSCGHRERGVQE